MVCKDRTANPEGCTQRTITRLKNTRANSTPPQLTLPHSRASHIHIAFPETPHMRICPLLLLTAAIGLAQTHTSAPEPTGTVTGRVFCADTNGPARFAHVSLEAIPDLSNSPSKNSPKPNSGPISLSRALVTTSVETTLDGSFTLTKVKPGAYYVSVEKEGYVMPRDIFTNKQIEDPSPGMRALSASALPRIVVESGHIEQAQVRLERGAAISGTIFYDDGSSASGLEVKLLHKDTGGKWVPLENASLTGTDDRGVFRIASLLGDEYMVEADLVLSHSKTYSNGPDPEGLVTLPFYGNGTARQSQATSVKLLDGQEITGQDMVLPIPKLHKLTGRVAAGPDAHIVNAAAVALIARDDNQQLATADISSDDGLFEFEFVPEGNYILRVTNARDAAWDTLISISSNPIHFPPSDKERVLASYGNVDQPLILSGDMLDVIVTVPPKTDDLYSPIAK